MERQTVPVTVTVREDLGLRPRSPDERIVRRHASIVAQAQRFSDVIAEILGFHAQTVVFSARAAEPVAVADGDQERAVLAEQHSPREVAARLPGIRDEYLLHVLEPVALQTAARNGQRVPTFTLLGVRDVDEPVLRELRMQRHGVQSVDTLSWRRR